ncbi:MAG: TetR/AcrR family transcriptional regulator [Actinomycetota bacterium]
MAIVTESHVGRAAEAEEAVRRRILGAAFDCAARFGLARSTMADVARQARLSRQTLYRYYPSRHDLILALVLREERALIDTVHRAMEPHRELEPAMRAAFGASLRAMRAHPLLDRVMASEPHELLPYLTTEANPVLEMCMRIMDRIAADRAPDVPARIRRRFNETCARVMTSYAITPPNDDPDTVAAELAELFCRGLAARSAP